MADLFGLAPDEISRIANSRVDTGRMAIDALQGAGYYNAQQANAYSKLHPDLVDLNFNGTQFTVRREDVPQAIAAGAQWLKATDKVPIKFGNQTYEILGSDIPEAIRAGAVLQELPSKIAANEARAGASTAAAGASNAAANLSVARQGAISDKQAAIQALKGVDHTELLNADNLSNAIAVNPGVTSSIATQQLRPPPAPKRDLNAVTPNLRRAYEVDAEKYNMKAQAEEEPYVKYFNGQTNIVVKLPSVGGKQLTADQVAKDAAGLGITINEWYDRYLTATKGK